MTWRSILLLLVACVPHFFGTGGASAQDASATALGDDDEEARRLFTAAESAVSAGRYDNALDYFQRAYELSERPELLYNIGLMADRLHRTDLAVRSFEAFLEAMPQTDNRADVERRIVALRTIEEEADADAEGGSTVAPLVLSIGGGAVAVAGAVLLGYALSEKAALEGITGETSYATVADRHDAVPVFSSVGIVLLAAGGAALASGLLWWALSSPRQDSNVELVVGPLYLGMRARL